MIRPRLPIDEVLPQILEALRVRSTLVIEAPPGAGKTTRVPIAALDAGIGRGEVLVLEPRRLAARLAARRVAEERGERPGETVGWQVRFEDVSGPKTRLRFLTEGVLVRRLLSDPDLVGVGALFLDEFHERHLEGDLALALLRRLQKRRPDLRLVVMSATLEAAPLAEWLGAAVIRAYGRRFEVAIEYAPQEDRRVLHDRVPGALKRLVREGLEGDVLVFLPGAQEIRRAMEACGDFGRGADLMLLPLHGSSPPEEQDRALQPAPKRKVIFSTNVAETSVTIEGISVVVDSGLARKASVAPWSGLPVLKLSKISRASATQRAGRAGRTHPGRCLRLYTRLDYDQRSEHEEPEIRRADLAEAVLLLSAAGVAPRDLAWLEPPPSRALDAASKLLDRLGATRDGTLTAAGRRMLRFSVHPRLARLVLESEARGAGEAGCLLAALVSEPDNAFAPCAESGASDLFALRDRFIDAPRASVERVRKKLVRELKPEQKRPSPEDEALRIAVLAAYPDRVARRLRGGELALAEGGRAQLARSSVVQQHPFLVAVDAEERQEPGSAPSVIVRLASAIEPEWIVELFPDAVRAETTIEWNAPQERVDTVSRLIYGTLVLEESGLFSADETKVADVLAAAALARGAREFCDASELDRLLARVRFVREACPEAGLPPLGEDEARAELVALSRGLRSFAELRQAGLLEALFRRLGPKGQGALAELAPDRLTLSRGRTVRVEYEPGKPPSVASRLQDFFGMTRGPQVAGGRVAVVLHLLAPNRRAVQVTTDLGGFWERAYPSVRKELSRKYPKHDWPEDPIGRKTRPPASRRSPS